MKRAKKPVFFIVFILIAVLAFTSIAGVYARRGDFKDIFVKGTDDIRWGIDIRGGVEATFSPAGDIEATASQLEAAKSILEVRLVSNNITDYELYTDSSNNRLIVRFPWKSDEQNFDPEAAIEELAATALLTFREGNEYETEDYTGEYLGFTPKGVTAENIILQGAEVENAQSQPIQNTSTGAIQYQISLKFSDEGTKKFAEATEKLQGSPVSIWMDDVMISAPTVNAVITDGAAVIEGNFSSEEATALATKIQAGALPFALETSNFNTITPALGSNALGSMATAGVIAFILISILMLVVYRLPGFVAVVTLAGQIGVSFAAVSGYFPFFNSFTMTLPGIAGIILSIGMGVDANVITASRISEELKKGKSLDNAIKSGSSESFWAIFDGNITVIIVALMLIGVFGPGNILSVIFGQSTTGAIYSFGYTLLIGTIGNFIMGLYATRAMTKSLSAFKFLRNPWLYGAAAEGKEKKTFAIPFYEKRKMLIGISLAIMAVGLVFNVVKGTRLDVQFAGGAEIKYIVTGDNVGTADIEDLLADKLGKNANVSMNEAIGDDNAGQKFVTVTFAGNQGITVEEQKNVATILTEGFDKTEFELLESSSVDPVMGSKFLQKCLVCIALTFILLLIYIAFRFRKIGGLAAGATALLALFHDVIITYFVFVVFGMPINDNFIAIILTILGYSLNDTIVIYDRIRENSHMYGSKLSISENTDLSLNQTMGRSIMTSVATFCALLVVYVVAVINNLDSVKEFALPMMIGVVAGCYSSLVIAAPVFAHWQIKKEEKAKSGKVKKTASAK
jgi:Preprotein translocase subunit SecD